MIWDRSANVDQVTPPMQTQIPLIAVYKGILHQWIGEVSERKGKINDAASEYSTSQKILHPVLAGGANDLRNQVFYVSSTDRLGAAMLKLGNATEAQKQYEDSHRHLLRENAPKNSVDQRIREGCQAATAVLHPPVGSPCSWCPRTPAPAGAVCRCPSARTRTRPSGSMSTSIVPVSPAAIMARSRFRRTAPAGAFHSSSKSLISRFLTRTACTRLAIPTRLRG